MTATSTFTQLLNSGTKESCKDYICRLLVIYDKEGSPLALDPDSSQAFYLTTLCWLVEQRVPLWALSSNLRLFHTSFRPDHHVVLCWLVEQRVPLWALGSNLRLFPHKLSTWPSRGTVLTVGTQRVPLWALGSNLRLFHTSFRSDHHVVESVAQSKRTRSRRPKLSTIDRGHQIDRWPLRARFCARPEISLESKSVQILQKSFGWDYKPRSPVGKKMMKWIDDHYVLGFALNQRFLWSQILCRSYKSPPDETTFQ